MSVPFESPVQTWQLWRTEASKRCIACEFGEGGRASLKRMFLRPVCARRVACPLQYEMCCQKKPQARIQAPTWRSRARCPPRSDALRQGG